MIGPRLKICFKIESKKFLPVVGTNGRVLKIKWRKFGKYKVNDQANKNKNFIS